jgi:hypothetical protein
MMHQKRCKEGFHDSLKGIQFPCSDDWSRIMLIYRDQEVSFGLSSSS